MDADGAHVPDTGVRLYRFALTELSQLTLPRAGSAASNHDFVVGAARTDTAGVFTILGVPPRGTFMLHGGIGTTAPTHVLVRQTPGPGELIDLGDIELEQGAILEGTVVDGHGQPVEDVTVRAADLPAQLLELVPAQHFDAQGIVLMRSGERARALSVPPWIEAVLADLPIPTARTDTSGHFRLLGVSSGDNILTLGKAGYLPTLNTGLVLDPGERRDLGRLPLQSGQRIAGRITDTRGVAIQGAEVAVVVTQASAVIEFGRLLGTTDAAGHFTATGFAQEAVTLAARRHPGHPWIVSPPQIANLGLRLQLPSVATLAVHLSSEDGEPVEAPRLHLVARDAPAGQGKVESWLDTLAQESSPDPDATTRFAAGADGSHVAEGLSEGAYMLRVRSDSHAAATLDLQLEGHRELAVTLAAQVPGRVLVTDEDGIPIENAAIYSAPLAAGARAEPRRTTCHGHTDAAGRLAIRDLSTADVRVTAKHPEFGVVHLTANAGAGDIVLVMTAPAAIEGVLLEGGER